VVNIVGPEREREREREREKDKAIEVWKARSLRTM
jgi:hypothetical protein